MKKLTQDPDRLKALAILIVALVIAAVVCYFVFRKPVADLWKKATDPIRHANQERETIEYTGVQPTLSPKRAEQLATQIYSSFGKFLDEEDAIESSIRQCKNVADWDLLVNVFGEKPCKAYYHGTLLGSARDETLPSMIANHLKANEQKPIREYLNSIGVENPGF